MVRVMSQVESNALLNTRGTPPLDEPDETDLLIRSLSTLLHRVHPQVHERFSREKDKEDRDRDTLDRLATLFVRRGGTDVAAITAHRGPFGRSTLAAVHESGIQPLLAPYQLLTNSSLMAGTTANCQKTTKPGDVEGTTNKLVRVVRYIYFYGLDKVNTRLKLHVAVDSHLPFLRLFFSLSTKGKLRRKYKKDSKPHIKKILTLDVLQKTVFKNRPRGWLTKLSKHDERWLLSLIKEKGASEHALVRQDEDVFHLNLTTERGWAVFQMFFTTLEKLRGAIQQVMNSRVEDDEKHYTDKQQKEAIKSALESIATILHRISRLTYTSISFWRVMFTMDPDLQYKPASANLCLLTHKVTQRLSKLDPDEDETRTGSASFRDVTSEAARFEGLMVRLGEPYYLGELTDRLRHWLKCLSAWEKAVQDLITGTAIHQVIDSGLQIELYEVKLPSNRNRQASLESTLQSVKAFLKNQNLSQEQQLALLAKGAARNKGHPSPSQDCLLDLPQPEMFGQCLRKWPQGFVGHLHCESVLGLLLGDSGAKNPNMGVSKLCCAYCARFLKGLGYNPDVRMQHGQVFPWSPPQGTPQTVKQNIVIYLSQHLAEFLDNSHTNDDDVDPVVTEYQSPSGSETHSDPESIKTKRYLNADDDDNDSVRSDAIDASGDSSGVEDSDVDDDDLVGVKEEVKYDD
ncbi:hypothetical protein FRB90_010597 [Tulasnella sp. 427]|nr:hypothetical protein FRB90_010597 [Tulasnella sp. 427]